MMKRHLKLSLFPLGLFGILAALIWVPSLRVSVSEMKSRAALHLNRGDSRAQVETFLHAQHMRMTSKTIPQATANGQVGATRLSVTLKPMFASPLYCQFDFFRDALISYEISDDPKTLGISGVG